MEKYFDVKTEMETDAQSVIVSWKRNTPPSEGDEVWNIFWPVQVYNPHFWGKYKRDRCLCLLSRD